MRFNKLNMSLLAALIQRRLAEPEVAQGGLATKPARFDFPAGQSIRWQSHPSSDPVLAWLRGLIHYCVLPFRMTRVSAHLPGE
ncbi:hypothetical protein [Halomonas sp. GD1P12]|uniref:hypothetical protein n=1 Tax=Halomonas sp. GD1P12 TaxID=2982691 RepID=UPI0021E4D695|nr:hypothetical protein [Halomonas sp. GD1P12]UYG00528.1 hypothetical protein OCT39_02920 [Halomonas sp. GD1P12]